MRAVEMGGGRIAGMVLGVLAGSRAVLTKKQRNLGSVLIDIGAGTTGMAVYEENKLLGVSVFPVGSGNATSDLAVGLRLPVDAAEEIKINYGSAWAKDVNHKESVDLMKFSPEGKGMVSRRFLSEIVELRLAEILELVNNELRLLGKNGGLPGGAVLVGGGAKIAGISELAKQVLKLSAQVGASSGEEWSEGTAAFAESFEDPEFANALGLVVWGAEKEGWRKRGFVPWKGAGGLWRYFSP
jgi:cell division protein FtsA